MQQPAPAELGGASRGWVVNVLSHMGVRRFSAIEFLVVLVLWIVSASFLWQIKYGDLIETVLATLALWSAVLAVSSRRRTLVTAILLMAPGFVCKWVNHVRPDVMPP